MTIILQCTNHEGRRIFHQRWIEVTRPELYTYIGVVLLAGVYRSNKEPIIHLWNKTSGRSVFPNSMSRNRFTDITRCLRFDDRETRAERRERDKLAPIRQVTDIIQRRCVANFRPSQNLCVDEQLVLYRGRCGFKVYMPSKPGKYGIKIWICADVDSSYCCNFDVYTGQMGRGPEIGQGERVVLQLTEPYTGSGRNVTADHFFSPLHLARALLTRRMTYVGTLRKNKPFLPAEFRGPAGMPRHASIFGFQRDVTIVKYIPKARRSVALISTMHYDAAVSEQDHQKPEIILSYNKCKGGVDNLDKMLRTYTCIRKTKRWPLALFGNLLDIAAYNAFVCFMNIHPNYERTKSHRRRIFLERLAMELISQQEEPEAQNVPRRPIIAARPPVERRRRKRRCSECPRADDKKTPEECELCSRPICKDHTRRLCPACFPQ